MLLHFARHIQILAGLGVGYGKSDSQRTKPTIFLQRLKKERKLLTAYIVTYELLIATKMLDL